MAGAARRRCARRSPARFAPALAAAGLALGLGGGAPAGAHEDRSDTLARLDRAIATTPDDPELWRTRAAIERRRGGFPRAHRDLARAVTLGLDPALAARERGQLLLAEGRAGEAEAALRAAWDAAPDDLAARLAHARALAALGRWAEAADGYARLVARAPQASPDVHLERVRALEAQGPAALDAALAAAEAGLAALGPVPALEQAALALERRAGRVDAALARLARMAAGREAGEALLLQRAALLEEAGRREAAAAAYEEALAAAHGRAAARGTTPATAAVEAQARGGLARLAKAAAP